MIRGFLLTLALVGCGRIGFGGYGEGELVVDLAALDPTTIPAGASISIQPRLVPAVPGQAVTITIDGGTLRLAGGADATTLDLVGDGAGERAAFQLRAPIDTREGTLVTLEASIPATGDRTFQVVEPRLVDVPEGYEVTSGYSLEVVAQSPLLVGRQPRIAIPPDDSEFEAAIYVAAGGNGVPPVIVRVRAGALETFAVSDGTTGPDETASQIRFAPPSSAFGDRLFVCSASDGTGDGLFTVDPAGSFAVWASFNNCNGLTFDPGKLLGDPGFDPMYVNIGSKELTLYEADQTSTVLTTSLPIGASGWKLEVHEGGGFPTGLYLRFPVGTESTPDEGALWFAPSSSTTSLVPLVASYPRPYSSAFGTSGHGFGDVLYISTTIDGTIVGLRPDLSTFTLVKNLAGAADIVFDPDQAALWIAEQTTGRLLVVRPDE